MFIFDQLTLTLTIGVPLAIILYIVKSDRFPEPTHLIIKTFFLGVFLCFPAGFLNGFVLFFEPIVGIDLSFMAGFTEEPLKFLAFMLFIKPRSEFNEPMDAIVYGSIISLGFATYENLEYVYLLYGDQSLAISILRAISAIPLHASCGIIMGYYIGLYIFYGKRMHLIQAILIPTIIHAVYNFLASYTGILFFIYLVGVIAFAYFANKSFVNVQNNQISENQEKAA